MNRKELKVLYVATSDIHIHTFHIPYLKWLKEQGCEVHVAAEKRGDFNFSWIDQFIDIPFPRTPFTFKNIDCYRKLKSLIQLNNYSLIHCHTPVPGVLARLAASTFRKKGTKVLYTAHGFHFFRGAPVKYWLFYYPVELLLSAFTDGIITLNREDYGYINNKMLQKDSFYIKGIGVDASRFKTLTDEDRKIVRKRLDYSQEDFILLFTAEFIYRKNHQFIIESVPELVKLIPELKIVFAGKGILMEQMKELSLQLNVASCINFLGFRTDVADFAAVADIGISSSRQEGLPIGIVEDMLCSLPVIATVDRGHKDLIEQGVNGYLYPQNDRARFIDYIFWLYNDAPLRNRMGKAACLKAQEFTIEQSLRSMINIYGKYLNLG
jgi:glycosyltransferase EpsD